MNFNKNAFLIHRRNSVKYVRASGKERKLVWNWKFSFLSVSYSQMVQIQIYGEIWHSNLGKGMNTLHAIGKMICSKSWQYYLNCFLFSTSESVINSNTSRYNKNNHKYNIIIHRQFHFVFNVSMNYYQTQ